MKDPERLGEKDGGDPGARMLGAARRYRVPEATRKRAFAAAGLLAGGTVAGAGKTAVAAGIALKLRWWVAAGVVGLSAAGGYLALRPPAKAPSVASAVVPPSAPAQQVREAPPQAPPQGDVQTGLAMPNSAASGPPPRATVSGNPRSVAQPRQAPRDLQAELAALDGASTALRRGDAASALAQLDAYEHDFPRRSLGMEATVLRAEALESAGRHAEALALARAFVKDHPKSPLMDRMRRIAGE